MRWLVRLAGGLSALWMLAVGGVIIAQDVAPPTPMLAFAQLTSPFDSHIRLIDPHTVIQVRPGTPPLHESELNWSPDGRWLGYTPDDGLGNAISLALFDVRTFRHTAPPNLQTRDIVEMIWSSDGQWVAFSTGFGGGFQLVQVADGAFQQAVTVPESIMQATPLHFSADSRRLLLAQVIFPENVWGLSVLDVTSGEVQAVGRVPTFSSLIWTADGRYIVYTDKIDSFNDIYALDTHNGDVRNLTETDTEEFTPVGIPGPGGLFVYTAREHVRNQHINALRVMNAAGDTVYEPLASFDYYETHLFPRPSPDGTRIALTARRRSEIGFRLMVVPVTGGTPLSLTPPNTDARIEMQWSPDSRWIAFAERGRGYRADLFLVPADGSAPPRRLTDDPGHNTSIAWQPVGPS